MPKLPIKKHPRIAVLLAAYNGEMYLEEQLRTILYQNDVYLDLYISLDLSTDNSLKIINNFLGQHHNIILLPYGQRFGSAAPNFYHLLLNVPIENYDYVALADQDDIWKEKKLVTAIDILKIQSAYGYSSNVIAFWENRKRWLINKAYPQCKYDYLFEAPGPGCTFVLRRDLALDIKRYFSERQELLVSLNYHDWLIYAFARSRCYKWVIDIQALIEYRQHSNNQFGVNKGLKALKTRIKRVLFGDVFEQVIKTVYFLQMENNDFVRKWYYSNRINYFYLAFCAKMSRRNQLDKIIFFFLCMISFILKLLIKK